MRALSTFRALFQTRKHAADDGRGIETSRVSYGKLLFAERGKEWEWEKGIHSAPRVSRYFPNYQMA